MSIPFVCAIFRLRTTNANKCENAQPDLRNSSFNLTIWYLKVTTEALSLLTHLFIRNFLIWTEDAIFVYALSNVMSIVINAAYTYIRTCSKHTENNIRKWSGTYTQKYYMLQGSRAVDFWRSERWFQAIVFCTFLLSNELILKLGLSLALTQNIWRRDNDE